MIPTRIAVVKDDDDPFDASEARFRAYFAASADCMFHLHVEPGDRMIYADVNPAGLSAAGLALEELLGRTPIDVLGPVKGAEMTEALLSVVRTGEPYRYEPTWEMEVGTVIYDALYIPLRDRSGAITGVLGTARDVTERRRVEAALRHAQRVEAVGQLAAGVAHDFNNLLAILRSCLRLLEREVSSEKARMVTQEGRAAIDRGKALTGWLMGFVRDEAAVFAPLDINAAMEQVCAMLDHALAGSSVALDCELASDLEPVHADPNELALALLNLGLNGRDAMRDGGTLRLSTRTQVLTGDQPDGLAPGRYAVVEVADTGEGMSPEVLARALEPFFTTKPAGSGTGLGLAMVQGIAQRAGGGLRIESALGEGTRVHLLLPFASSAGDARERRQAS
jgi:PAS domain S-box-containing protein